MWHRLRIISFLLFLLSFSLLFIYHDPWQLNPELLSFSSLIPSDLLIEDAWYGVYLDNAFLGYCHFFMKLKDLKEGGGYVLKNNTHLSLPVLGKLEPFRYKSIINLTSDYNLKTAEFKVDFSHYFLKAHINRQKSNLYKFYLKTPTQNFQKTVALENEFVSLFFPPFSLARLPVKREIQLPFYDPLLEEKRRVILKNKGKKIVKGGIEGYVIDMEMDGLKGEIVIDEKGRILREEFLGFKLVREKPDVLFKKREAALDLTEYFAIKTEPLPSPEKINYLKIRIKGIESVLEDFNQKVSPQEDGFIVEVFSSSELPERLSHPSDYLSYLKEDTFIKFHSSLVEKILNSIIEKKEAPFRKVEKIFNWINQNIKKIPTLSLPDSLNVLKTRQGDCSEMAILMVALLRKAGIPSYMNIGLVHRKGRFFYHAWVSCYAGRWFDVDPALEQFNADATHIKLFKGVKEQFKIFKVIGRLKIEIIEYAYHQKSL